MLVVVEAVALTLAGAFHVVAALADPARGTNANSIANESANTMSFFMVTPFPVFFNKKDQC